MYVCMYACMYDRDELKTRSVASDSLRVCAMYAYVYMNGRDECMYVCMYVCMDVCMIETSSRQDLWPQILCEHV